MLCLVLFGLGIGWGQATNTALRCRRDRQVFAPSLASTTLVAVDGGVVVEVVDGIVLIVSFVGVVISSTSTRPPSRIITVTSVVSPLYLVLSPQLAQPKGAADTGGLVLDPLHVMNGCNLSR
jgi:hypothetical protein